MGLAGGELALSGLRRLQSRLQDVDLRGEPLEESLEFVEPVLHLPYVAARGRVKGVERGRDLRVDGTLEGECSRDDSLKRGEQFLVADEFRREAGNLCLSTGEKRLE